jgi:phosphatidylglycerol:prolipoprotein diacylglycerol transferase
VIPWINIELPSFGPLTIHVFGVLVAIGIIVGVRATTLRGRELGLSEESLRSMTTTILVGGFIAAHLFDVVAYQTSEGAVHWRDVINPFNGLSSFGGFAGAVAALFLWAQWHRERVAPYADALAVGLAPGWLFGRLGCFTAHDHPGRHTDFFLGVRYPGGARHDLGLDEALFAAALTILFALLRRRERPIGTYPAILALTYAPVRFGLDFLRANDLPGADARYYGLTPAQYGCLLLLAIGILLANATFADADARAARA